MSTVYIIKNYEENYIYGIVENKKEIAPFIIFTGVIDIFADSINGFNITQLLKCEYKQAKVVEYLENMSFELQKIIFENFNISIVEEEVWSYKEYLHNRVAK